MTIEEAITQLADLRKDRESFAKNDESDGVFAQDIEAIDIALEHMDMHGTYISMNAHNELYAKFEKQKSINYELVNDNQELIDENKKLKRLLRLAVEDLSRIDGVCDDYDDVCDECPCKVNILGRCEWKHAEEALKLIGDEGNA